MPAEKHIIGETITLVVKYGPAAIFVLYFYFSNRKIYSRITAGGPSNTSFWKKVFAFNLFVTLMFAIIAAYLYYVTTMSESKKELDSTKKNYTSCDEHLNTCKNNLSVCQKKVSELQPKSISGKILAVSINDTLRSHNENVYLKNYYERESNTMDVNWIIIRNESGISADSVRFKITNSEKKLNLCFKIPVKCFDISTDNVIQIKNKITPMMVLDRTMCGINNFPEEGLEPEADLSERPVSPAIPAPSLAASSFFESVAYAQQIPAASPTGQQPFEKSKILQGLNSDNPKDNENALSELIAHCVQSIPLIQEIIMYKDATYRQLLGATSALRKIDPKCITGMHDETIKILVKFAGGENYGLRINALRFFTNNFENKEHDFGKILSKAYSDALVSNKGQNKSLYLAIAYFEYLYNLGMKKTYEYTETNYQDNTIIADAISYLDTAWKIKNNFSEQYKVYFIKALYGKGLAIHDHYKVIQLATGTLDSKLKKEAIAAFQYFLDQYNSCTDKDSYPYQESITTAQKFINTPD